MEKNSEILDELKDLQSPLADMPRNMPFEVPKGYFNDLAEHIIEDIQALDKTTAWKTHTPYAVPGRYFDQLPNEILARAKQTAPIIAKRKNIILPAFRWAAAAVVILGVGFMTYTNITRKPVNTEQAISTVPDELIKDYLRQNMDDIDPDLLVGGTPNIDARLDVLEEEDIIYYLDETGWDKENNGNL